MPGFKYNVVFPFGFEALAKYASFLFFCLYVLNSPWRPKLIHSPHLRDGSQANREVSLFRGRFCLVVRTVPDLELNDLGFYLIIDFYNSIGIIGRKYLIRRAARIKE